MYILDRAHMWRTLQMICSVAVGFFFHATAFDNPHQIAFTWTPWVFFGLLSVIFYLVEIVDRRMQGLRQRP